MIKAELLVATYKKHGPLTVRQAQQITGLHPSQIRSHVKPPHYRPVSHEWATRRWETTWAYCDQTCDCGQPAWYYGRVTMTFHRVQKEVVLLLCPACAKIADEDIAVEPIQ